jgi:hypothetical protein
VREWTFTLPSELPLWELESRWTFKSLKNNCKGKNIIGLKCRCLKWACLTYLDTSNTSYVQKKGRESNWQFDSWPLKVKNRPDFFTCRWHATYCWKALDEGYNFALNLISVWGFHTKLWGPKVARVPVVGISGLPLGSPGTKWHLGAGPMAKHRIYYKGQSDGFPQVWAMVSLVSPSLPVARLNIKSVLAMH